MRTRSLLTILFPFLWFAVSAVPAAEAPAGKPNLLLIVADDMGYSDAGCFGGEIKTPNIDALAARGLRGTDFYVAPSCSPSRSMLLTGTDNHIAGIGNMVEWIGVSQKGKPGYEGYLNNRLPCVATLLRGSGYHTVMAGKWHLGEHPDQWPVARGFDRDFAMLQGAGSHWADMLGLLPTEPQVSYTRNGKRLESLPADYYSSKNFTDFVIENISDKSRADRPFFAYLSYQAPHGPLAVPEDWIDRYKGRYDRGYDVIREERMARQKQLGIIGGHVECYPRLAHIPAWTVLTEEQRRHSARRMEIYASMIEYMDDQVGRLIDHLKQTGEYDNTLILFISDNGAAGEDMGELVTTLAPTARDWFEKTFDNRPENWGRRGSCSEYGPAWAQVSSVPFRLFKGFEAEGGIRAPLIISGPGVTHRGKLDRSAMHVMDIGPTLLEAAGVEHPATKAGGNALTPQGKSLWPLLSGREQQIRGESDWLGWELFGNRAIRSGDWKLLYLQKAAGGTGDWELFNLREDPSEMRDLSAAHPDRRKALLALWEEYVKRNGVIISEAGPFAPREPASKRESR